MKNQNTHFYLYAKGWYVTDNVVDDVRKLVAHRNQIDWQYVSVGDARIVLTEIVWKEIERGWHFEYAFKHLISNFSEKGHGTDIESVFYALLNFLWEARSDGLDLGEPDADILPLTHYESSQVG